MQLTLIVPGLLALSGESLAAARSLAVLAHYAAPPRVEPLGIAAALVDALGATRDTPIAPLALLGAGTDPRGDYVLHADPVHLAADRDTVVLLRRIDDLSADEAERLVRKLDRHFAQDDLRFDAVRPDAWFARRTKAPDIATTPPDAALGRSILAHLAQGADAGRWKRWQNEIEMLLHDDEVNVAREGRGAPAVSSVWFWGGGRLADAGALPATVTAAPAGAIGDLARGIAVHGRGAEASLPADAGIPEALARARALAATHVLVVAAADAAPLDRNCVAPALDLLAHAAIDTLRIVADGAGFAASWTARAPGFWQRVAARTRAGRFEVPRDPGA